MKKRIFLALLITVAMVAAMLPAGAAAETSASAKSAAVKSAGRDLYARVGLVYGTGSPEKAEISAKGGLTLSRTGDIGEVEKHIPSETEAGNIKGQPSVTLVNKGKSGGIDVLDAKGNSVGNLSGNGTECIIASGYFTPDAKGERQHLSYNGHDYRGGIIPFINDRGDMNIINYVSTDDYVRGVLHAEIGQSSAIEAIKAQAVTTRSFVYANANTHKSQGFGVCSTTHCQVYKGISGEYPKTEQAVKETSNQMMYYKGKPVAGYYSANSGGHTQNSEDVWVAEIGYLRGVKDEYSPELNWEVKIPKSKLDEKMAPRKIGKVISVSIDRYNSAGAAASVTIHGTEGDYTVKKDNIRSMFGSGYSLKSTMFRIGKEKKSAAASAVKPPSPPQPPKSPAPTETSYYAAGADGNPVKLGNQLSVISAGGRAEIPLDGMNMLGAGGSKAVASVPENGGNNGNEGNGENGGGTVSADTVYLDSPSDVLVISGRGFGHGVGMSQQGAQVMGKKGFSYIDILKYYYTDIEVR